MKLSLKLFGFGVAIVAVGLTVNTRVERARRLAHDQEIAQIYAREHVLDRVLQGIRLGDAVPLDLDVSLRWRAEDPLAMARAFPDPELYEKSVLEPRAMEIASRIANRYPSVAAVFGPDRETFVGEIRTAVVTDLGEPGLTIRGFAIARVIFPESLTTALEHQALKEHELGAVRQENAISLERAKSSQAQAEADGKVAIARAEAEGKVAEIAARTEEKNRATAVARAETEAQLVERKAKADAAKLKLLAQAEAEKQKLLAEVETDKVATLKNIEIDRRRSEKDIEVEKEQQLAAMCASNPAYASFLVSKELASKVQIAVLPTGSDPGTIGTLLQSMNPVAQSAEKRRR